MASTTTITDEVLLARAHRGDSDALHALLERHLHPAWRIATVAAADPGLAEQAVVDGFCDALQAAHRNPDSTMALRSRIVGTTRRTAALADAGAGTTARPTGDPVIDAFRALPEKARSLLWLTEVEGGTSDQVAPVLGLDRAATAKLAARSGAALRKRLAADVAGRVDDLACRRALSSLPAHAAGKLTADEQERIGHHVASCGSCAAWLAALVSPRPALRRLVCPPPSGLAPAVAARWMELLERNRRGWLAPFTERALGAAAAAVLAIGIGGVLLFGNRDDDDGPELANPASVQPEGDDPGAGASPGESALGSYTTPLPSGNAAAVPAATSRLTTSTTAPRFEMPRSGGGTSTSTPTPSAPTTAPTPTTTPPPDDPTPPPADDPTPPPDESGTQVDVGVGGVAALGVGDCTGGTVLDVELGSCVPESSDEPIDVQIELPGLPPIGL